jgi:hypothetical protein
MPRIARLANVSIYIHADDHAPPHFHVVGPDTDVKVAIETLQVIRAGSRAPHCPGNGLGSREPNASSCEVE